MTSKRIIPAKGGVTPRRVVLDHLDVESGDNVGVSPTQDRRVALVPTSTAHDLSGARGLLRRRGQQRVSLREMQEAIKAGRER